MFRSNYASTFVASPHTIIGLAPLRGSAIPARMFDKAKFLEEVHRKARTKAAISRALDIPSSRVAELYNGDRRLTMEEGMKLAEAFGVSPVSKITADQLAQVLRVCLRHEPAARWSDQEIRRLSQEIELGLELLQGLDTNQTPPVQADAEAGDQGDDTPA